MPRYRLFSLSAIGLAAMLLIAGIALSFGSVIPAHAAQTQPQDKPPQDHSKISTLNKDFANGSEVTQACLSCHPDAAKQIMQTTHWTWLYEDPNTGEMLGKQNIVNNYCISVASNEPRCTSCHVGYGWQDNTFDFTNELAVDCLVCHDTTGTYVKIPTGAGAPDLTKTNLTEVARNVGPTSRQTCGSCHFYGGGGDAVKHGDLDSSLANPTRETDVHMAADGANMNCTDCHQTEGHEIPGTRYPMNSTDRESCETCHEGQIHPNPLLDKHTERIACQTCHIPEFARGGKATKMTWDWSTAGEKNEDGTLKKVKDENGNIIYDTMKGTFVWTENVTPEYVWFNGQMDYMTIGEKIDPAVTPVQINPFFGSRTDPTAKIYPVKRFLAVQPYDSVNNVLAIPHLFGSDENAFWKSYDWQKAIAFGMAYAGVEYSGEYDFIETEMLWMETHMVAPAANAVQCAECHTAEDSRLNFVALGYSTEEAERLVNFPPNLAFTTPEGQLVEDTPEYCAECHEGQHTQWAQSNHGSGNVGCLACHEKMGTDDHPLAAFSVDRTEYTCGICHLDYLTDWKQSKHGQSDITCISCHEAHTQAQRVIEGNQTACETCHKDQKEAVSHSTHLAAGLLCSDCHTNSEINTGHTFAVASDTCLLCHAEEIHTANQLVLAGQVEPAPMPVETQPAPAPEPRVITFPIWMAVILGIFLGFGGFWVIAGRNPGDQHPENR